jgi:hypothetical protein
VTVAAALPKPPSYTYAALDATSLQQGDVLRRTDELEKILRAIRPEYPKSDYKYFQVLTQSCDLVRRDGKPCSARYITIAAVRPVSLAIERYAKYLRFDAMEAALNFSSDERKAKLRQFVERLLNNNEIEFFYLHKEESTGFPGELCAFLQLSIALNAQFYYDQLLAAKVLQLDESFQHKLGYLVGTSYSRVGTDDWAPNYVTEDVFKSTVTALVEAVDMVWLERPTHQKVIKRLEDLPPVDRTPDNFERIVREVRKTREQFRQEVLGAIAQTAQKIGIGGALLDQLKGQLTNSDELRTLLDRGRA